MTQPYNLQHKDKQCRRWDCINAAELGPLYQGYCRQHKPPMFNKREGYTHYHTPRPGNWATIRKRKIDTAVKNGTPCEVCGKPILKGQPVDVDHRDTERGADIHADDNLRVLHRTPCHSGVTQAASIASMQARAIKHATATDRALEEAAKVRAERRKNRRV